MNSRKDVLKYYIFCALFQTIWGLAVIAFVIYLLNFFKTPYCLFALALVLLKPYATFKYSERTESTKQDQE